MPSRLTKTSVLLLLLTTTLETTLNELIITLGPLFMIQLTPRLSMTTLQVTYILMKRILLNYLHRPNSKKEQSTNHIKNGSFSTHLTYRTV